MKKNLFTCILTAIAAASMLSFTGCGNTESSKDNSSNDKAVTRIANEVNAPKIRILAN